MKLAAILIITVLLFAIQYVVATVGWGLAVQSWPVVIVGFLVSIVLGALAQALAN